MGIELYFPRMRLPGAKPSPDYDLDVGQADSPARPVSEPTTARQAASSEKPATVLPKVASEQQAAAAVNADSSAASEELRFSLRYYKINAQLAVIDEIPHQLSKSNQSSTIALLRSILRALQIDIAAVDFQAESLSWPLAEALSMKNDPSTEARNALFGFIRVRRELDKFKNLLVFAGQINDLLLPPDSAEENYDYQVNESDYFITVTNSLQSMLAYPLLKRDVWRQLQALRQRLGGLS
jgi:hypothetical protein